MFIYKVLLPLKNGKFFNKLVRTIQKSQRRRHTRAAQSLLISCIPARDARPEGGKFSKAELFPCHERVHGDRRSVKGGGAGFSRNTAKR
jgi:hypothetical protein